MTTHCTGWARPAAASSLPLINNAFNNITGANSSIAIKSTKNRSPRLGLLHEAVKGEAGYTLPATTGLKEASGASTTIH